jgi:chromosome segregation ATPase
LSNAGRFRSSSGLLSARETKNHELKSLQEEFDQVRKELRAKKALLAATQEALSTANEDLRTAREVANVLREKAARAIDEQERLHSALQLEREDARDWQILASDAIQENDQLRALLLSHDIPIPDTFSPCSDSSLANNENEAMYGNETREE